MSIGIQRSVAMRRLAESRAAAGLLSAVFPYRLQCRACGFEPEDAVVPPPRCPKCTGQAWERFAMPRSLLMYAERSTAAQSVAPALSLRNLGANQQDCFFAC